QAFVHREHDEADLPRAVVLREGRWIAAGAGVAEVLARAIVDRGRLRGFEVDVDVDGSNGRRVDAHAGSRKALVWAMVTRMPGPLAPYSCSTSAARFASTCF